VRECLDRAILADRVGFDGVWAADPHSCADGGPSAAAGIFFSAAALATNLVRLGPMITPASVVKNYPDKVARRLALLDTLTEGRINWGMSGDGGPSGQGGFSSGSVRSHPWPWLDAHRRIVRSWVEGGCGPDRGAGMTAVPRPVQRPHPPIFMVVGTPAGAAEAGGRAIGVLDVAGGSLDALGARILGYRRAGLDAQPLGVLRNDHYALLVDVHDLVERGAGGSAGMSGLRHRFASLRDAGVEEVALDLSTCRADHEQVMGCIRSFAEQVIPYFR
jgi:alkanesulfonate monooxygenase SsuD/methylene tetrahydromethanopterin reductase-like flavin-dependent oxidoreductase (luciferase family)